MMHSMHFDDHTDDSSDELLFPSALHKSPVGIPDALPRLQDSSWLGARVSPVPFYSDEEDDNNDELTSMQYKTALHRVVKADERSSLITGKPKRSTLHPLWDDDHSTTTARTAATNTPKKDASRLFGEIIIVVSAFSLFCMALHDFYLWYISYRRGIDPKYSLKWTPPCFTPPSRTLQRFGAFSIKSFSSSYWRIFTSIWTPSSTVEWVFVALSWREAQIPRSFVYFFVSIAAGQLWMASFQPYAVSGCVAWGTCGVLCATGVSQPNRRFHLFVYSIVIILVNLIQPSGSTFGAIAASFSGWSLKGSFPPSNLKGGEKKKWSCLNWISIAGFIQLWLVPILRMTSYNVNAER